MTEQVGESYLNHYEKYLGDFVDNTIHVSYMCCILRIHSCIPKIVWYSCLPVHIDVHPALLPINVHIIDNKSNLAVLLDYIRIV